MYREPVYHRGKITQSQPKCTGNLYICLSYVRFAHYLQEILKLYRRTCINFNFLGFLAQGGLTVYKYLGGKYVRHSNNIPKIVFPRDYSVLYGGPPLPGCKYLCITLCRQMRISQRMIFVPVPYVPYWGIGIQCQYLIPYWGTRTICSNVVIARL